MVYSNNVRKLIQKIIKAGSSDIKNINYPEKYTAISVGDINIIMNPLPRKDAFIKNIFGAENRVTSEYIKVWKQHAPGKFMIRDFMKGKMDITDETKTPYYVMVFSLDEQKYKVLLRKLVEIDEELPPHEKKKLIDSFGDITWNEMIFSIMKISLYDEDEPNIWNTIYPKKIDITHESFIEIIPVIDGTTSINIDNSFIENFDNMSSYDDDSEIEDDDCIEDEYDEDNEDDEI